MDSMGYTNTSGLKVGGSVWWSFYSIETDKTKAAPLFTVVSYLCKSQPPKILSNRVGFSMLVEIQRYAFLGKVVAKNSFSCETSFDFKKMIENS